MSELPENGAAARRTAPPPAARITLEINGVRVESGDIVFGDLDGVCVVPRKAEQDVFRLALEKARGERLVAKAIREGMTAFEAWAKFGIM